MNRHVCVLRIPLLFLILISACSFDQDTPVPTMSAQEVIPTATHSDSNSVTEITPSADAGVVSGILLLDSGEEAEPVSSTILSLAEVLTDSQGRERAASYDRINSPATTTDEQGRFVFTNIPPGTYGLVLDTVMNSYLLLQPGTQRAMTITVEAGEIVDLGELIYEKLPLPDQE